MRLTIDIEDLAAGGEGVGRSGGRMIFVPFTAPGDRALVEVPDEGQPGAGEPGAAAAHGALVAIERPGPVREQPPCRHFGPEGDLCGGCEWLHAAYLAQLSAKTRALRETLRRIARLAPDSYDLRPIAASPAPLRYRSRAKFHLARAAGADPASARLAFFRRRSHEPVLLAECHLLVPGLDALREALGPALGRARLAPREVALEWSELDGRGAALLVLGGAAAPLRERAEALLAELPALAGLVLRGDVGSPAVVGDPVLRQARDPADPAAGVQHSRPDVFQQANRGANARLVSAALDLLRPEGEDVLELFCGAGNFTAPLAARARSVAAVESLGPALELARADLTAASSVRFFAGDALALARAFARERGPGARRFGAALLDPPREGAKGIGPALRDLGVPRAVYVSCDPATFARDLRACAEAGFRVVAVQPVDMFPQTHHVEAIGLVERA